MGQSRCRCPGRRAAPSRSLSGPVPRSRVVSTRARSGHRSEVQGGPPSGPSTWDCAHLARYPPGRSLGAWRVLGNPRPRFSCEGTLRIDRSAPGRLMLPGVEGNLCRLDDLRNPPRKRKSPANARLFRQPTNGRGIDVSLRTCSAAVPLDPGRPGAGAGLPHREVPVAGPRGSGVAGPGAVGRGEPVHHGARRVRVFQPDA